MADSLNTTNLSRRSILGTGLAAAGALAAGAASAALAMTSEAGRTISSKDEREFRESISKVLIALGEAERDRRIMYWDYGGYSRKNRKNKTSGRFVIDLEGDDHLHLLMAIMTGCVLCGHKTVADFEAASAQRQSKTALHKTVVWKSTDPDGKVRSVHRRPAKTLAGEYHALRKSRPA
jgi:hypothetical protein